MGVEFQIYDPAGNLAFDLARHRLIRFYKNISIDTGAWYRGENNVLWYYNFPESDPKNIMTTAEYITCKPGKIQYWNAYAPTSSRPPSITIPLFRF